MLSLSGFVLMLIGGTLCHAVSRVPSELSAEHDKSLGTANNGRRTTNTSRLHHLRCDTQLFTWWEDGDGHAEKWRWGCSRDLH